MSDQHPDFERGIKQLQVLADPDRLHIAACLLEGSHTPTELAQNINKPVDAVMKHLEIMAAVGFVQCEGAGSFALYSFRPEISLSALGIGEGLIDFGCCRLTLTQIKPPE